MWNRGRHSPRLERSDVSSDTTATTSPGDRDREIPSGPVASTPSGGAQLLRFFTRSGRRGGASDQHAQNDGARLSDEDNSSNNDLHSAEKHRMERVYREVSGQTRRKSYGRQGTDDTDDLAWVDMEGNVAPHLPPMTTIRVRRKKKQVKASEAAAAANATTEDGEENREITVDYLNAVLVKPDHEVFNKVTRFFLDRKLEDLYQEYTAVNWFGWAQGHIMMWICVHALVGLVFVMVPSSGFLNMDLFLMSSTSIATWAQYTYLVIALPFALLPSKVNPFQKHWRAWVCLLIILFNFTFQIWLASSNRAAIDVVIEDVKEMYECRGPNKTEIENSTTLPPTLEELQAKALKQSTIAIDVICIYASAMVQNLAVFSTAFNFLLIVSMRVEFVQCVVVGFTAMLTYVVVVTSFQLTLEWMTAVSYLLALILLLMLSHASDLRNRKSFLSQLVVQKENASLQSYLTKAEAVLMNDAACALEKHVVESVLDNPTMKHLDLVRIPFADIKLLQAIGRGAMGDVIKAKYFGTIVVCKRMRREHITEAAITSFREEIELMASLRHPNIVQFIGATWDNCSNVCIIMEYLENGDMHGVLHSTIGRHFSWADPMLKMAIDAAQGMLYLHSQENAIVHRDLKSVNIFCSATFGCKVGDFGLSRRYKKDIDALTTLVGTPFWLAPEIIRNERYGPSADVFSFGIVLTELETRRTPYHDLEETGLKVLMRIAQNKLRPSLPASCPPLRRQLIVECMHDEPAKRPTFAQILKRLQGPVQQEVEEDALQQQPLPPAAYGNKRSLEQATREHQQPPHHHHHHHHHRHHHEQSQQQPPPQQQRRDYFFDIISNVHNPV